MQLHVFHLVQQGLEPLYAFFCLAGPKVFRFVVIFFFSFGQTSLIIQTQQFLCNRKCLAAAVTAVELALRVFINYAFLLLQPNKASSFKFIFIFYSGEVFGKVFLERQQHQAIFTTTCSLSTDSSFKMFTFFFVGSSCCKGMR